MDDEGQHPEEDDMPGTKPLRPFLPHRDEPSDEPRATILFDGKQDERPPESYDTERVRLVPQSPQPTSWRVLLKTKNNPEARIGLDVRQTVVAGRHDPDYSDRPDLDLSPHLGQNSGVSRMHAALIPMPDGLYLQDLGSKNGTWLNGRYIEPGDRLLLSHGDRIEFGLLSLEIISISRIDRSRP